MKRMKPAPYRFDKDDEFRTPPPFVRCNCTYGRYSQFVKSAPGSTLDGAEYEITKPCGVCARSPLPGWLPVYYTPTEYRDWIRRENNLPGYELPESMPVWMKSGVNGWVSGALWEWRLSGKSFDQCIVRTEAGYPYL